MAKTEIRRRWESMAPDRIGSPEMEAAIAQEEKMAIQLAALGPVPPCPPGCLDEPDHGYDSLVDEDGTFARLHTLGKFGDTAVEVCQPEHNGPSGVVLKAPYIWQGYADGAYNAEQIRRMAAGLLNAADKLDEVTKATQ